MKRWCVSDVMTKTAITVSEDTSYKEIVEILVGSSVSAVPVVDARRRVVGVVSEADLLPKLEFSPAQPHAQLLERKQRRVARSKAGADTARDLMTSPAFVITMTASIATAARTMDIHRVKRLPVVDGAQRLVGVVSRTDLLRVYLRTDEAIRDEIIDDVLIRTLWIEPQTIAVTVERGIATLAGTADRRSTVSVIHRLVESVAGVVEVVDHLTYHYDDTAERQHRHVIAEVAG